MLYPKCPRQGFGASFVSPKCPRNGFGAKKKQKMGKKSLNLGAHFWGEGGTKMSVKGLTRKFLSTFFETFEKFVDKMQ